MIRVKKMGMRLGLDLHGVLDDNPELFIAMADMVTQYFEGEVHVITGAPMTLELEKELMSMCPNHHKWWTHFFSVQEYMIEHKFKYILDEHNCPHFAPSDWNKIKAEYCKLSEIDLHIDNDPEYLKHFTTPYMLYDSEPGVLKTDYKPLYKED